MKNRVMPAPTPTAPAAAPAAPPTRTVSIHARFAVLASLLIGALGGRGVRVSGADALAAKLRTHAGGATSGIELTESEATTFAITGVQAVAAVRATLGTPPESYTENDLEAFADLGEAIAGCFGVTGQTVMDSAIRNSPGPLASAIRNHL